MERILLDTSDHIKITADYWPGTSTCGVVLVHMMPATKESWATLAPELAARGMHVIAMDLRGHGASMGGPDGYKEFNDAQHQEGKFDVEAAARFVKDKGATDIALVGASIGANFALQYIGEHAEAHTAVLLSPGTNYRGVETIPHAAEVGVGKRVLIAASEDDMRKNGNNAAAMAREIHDTIPVEAEKKLIIYQAAGHGTDMFGKEEPDLLREIIEWVSRG